MRNVANPIGGVVLVASVAMAWLILVGCSPDRTTFGDGETSPENRSSRGDGVVASVDGVSITSDRVAELSRLTKRPAPEVLEKLVSFELLAAEARKRGYTRDADVRYAARQAMVHRFLEDFEATHGPDAIPRTLLWRSYQNNHGRFVHPRLRKVAHILVLAQDLKVSRARQDEAGRLAQKIYEKAASAKSVEEFQKIGKSFDGVQGFTIKIEAIKSPVVPGARLIQNFVDAAMKLENIGDVSPPVETAYGTHVIYLMDVKEASNVSFDEARSTLIEKVHPDWRKASFQKMVEDLRLSTAVIGFEGEKRRTETL